MFKRCGSLVGIIVFAVILIANTRINAQETAWSFQFPFTNYPTGDGCLGWGGEISSTSCTEGIKKHLADDACRPAETDVMAVANGKVMYAGATGSCAERGWVWLIVTEHTLSDGSKVCVVYGHIQPISGIQTNTIVSKGQHIGEVVSLSCYEDHIHFGVHPGPYGADPGVYASWIKGYVCPSDWPSGYVDPVGFINSHQATYSCSWHTQDPNTIVVLYPGDTRTFTVSYTNTGNTTWQNTGGVSNPNYIELRSCDSSGNVVNSWLYPGAPPWINAQRVVSQNATNVQPTQNAWFIFTGKVPNNATPGDYHIYFQPYHATGGYIQNWGGGPFANCGIVYDALGGRSMD